MYISHWHHTSNGVAVLPTTLIFMLVHFVQLFVFWNRTKPAKYAHYLQSWMKIEWFMSPLYYKQIINDLFAAITKKYNNKRSRKSLVYSPRTLWKTLHSLIFFYQSIIFMTDQCDRWLSDRKEQQTKLIFVLIGSLKYFLHVVVTPEQILQSCPVVARHGEELDAGLATNIQLLSWNFWTFWGSIS